MQSGLEMYIPKQHAAMMRKHLKEEWNNQCAYCGIKESSKKLTTDHIIPIAKQGTDDWCNLLPACRPCNLSKGNRSVRQWYFEQDSFTTERWNKIKLHMNRVEDNVFAA